MGIDGENKDKHFDEISELLKTFYKPEDAIDPEQFWKEISRKIDSLFHKEMYSEQIINEEGILLTDEERYWLGLEGYLKNEVSSLKHKTITDHLLACKECRQKYSESLNKKKLINSPDAYLVTY